MHRNVSYYFYLYRNVSYLYQNVPVSEYIQNISKNSSLLDSRPYFCTQVYIRVHLHKKIIKFFVIKIYTTPNKSFKIQSKFKNGVEIVQCSQISLKSIRWNSFNKTITTIVNKGHTFFLAGQIGSVCKIIFLPFKHFIQFKIYHKF